MREMGSRGASSGIAKNGKKYGEEFDAVYQSGNIKFVRYNGSTAAKSPQETMTKGRVYVTIATRNGVETPKYITYYDKNNKRYKQIDIEGIPHVVNGQKTLPHTHKGYEHDEKGTFVLTPREEKMVERVLKIWKNKGK